MAIPAEGCPRGMNPAIVDQCIADDNCANARSCAGSGVCALVDIGFFTPDTVGVNDSETGVTNG